MTILDGSPQFAADSTAPKSVGCATPFDTSPESSGKGAKPKSAIVKLMLVMAVLPPTSDQNSKLVPREPTSRKSRSSGNVCDRPLKVTTTSVTLSHTAVKMLNDF